MARQIAEDVAKGLPGSTSEVAFADQILRGHGMSTSASESGSGSDITIPFEGPEPGVRSAIYDMLSSKLKTLTKAEVESIAPSIKIVPK